MRELGYAACAGFLGGVAGFALFLLLCALGAFPDGGGNLSGLGPVVMAFFWLPTLGAMLGVAIGPVVAKYAGGTCKQDKPPPK